MHAVPLHVLRTKREEVAGKETQTKHMNRKITGDAMLNMKSINVRQHKMEISTL